VVVAEAGACPSVAFGAAASHATAAAATTDRTTL
jgi:hypothetical protein